MAMILDNRVRSDLTVISIEVTNINNHNDLVRITSGQLRNLGSRCRHCELGWNRPMPKRPLLGHYKYIL